MKYFLALSWLLTVCSPGVFRTEILAQNIISSERLSNYELLVSAGHKLIEKVINKSGVSGEEAGFFLTAITDDSVNWFIEKRLSSYLLNAGHNVFTGGCDSSTNSNKYLIEFNTVRIGIEYEGGFSKESQLKRTGSLAVDFKIIECKTNRILLNDIFLESITDRIAIADKQLVEDRDIDFTMGDVDSGSPAVTWKPFIITAVTGTIIYLFYSLRSR